MFFGLFPLDCRRFAAAAASPSSLATLLATLGVMRETKLA